VVYLRFGVYSGQLCACAGMTTIWAFTTLSLEPVVKPFSGCDGRFDSGVTVVPNQDALLAFQTAQCSYQFSEASRLSVFQRVAQPLGSLESGRPGTTFTPLSNRGLTYEQPFCDRLLEQSRLLLSELKHAIVRFYLIARGISDNIIFKRNG
jgi:hypothetical protein